MLNYKLFKSKLHWFKIIIQQNIKDNLRRNKTLKKILKN